MRRLPEKGLTMEKLFFSTRCREGMTDVTDDLRSAVTDHGWSNGVLTVFCPHTTCGITINEGFDPDVALDMTSFFRAHVPADAGFRHAEGNSDAHIKASLIGSSVQVIVEKGHLLLGTWQAVWLFEGDGPRDRQLWLKWMEA